MGKKKEGLDCPSIGCGSREHGLHLQRDSLQSTREEGHIFHIRCPNHGVEVKKKVIKQHI